MGAEQGAEFPEPIAVAVDVDHGDMMEQAIEDRRGEDLVTDEDLGPVADSLFDVRSIEPRS